MDESVIIPVEFDTSKSTASLAGADTPLKNMSDKATGLKGVFSDLGRNITNSFAAFATGGIAVAAVGVIANIAREFFGAAQAVDQYDEAVRSATESTGVETFKLNALVAVARDETKSREQRNNAISQLQKQYPDYLRNINLETINSAAASKAIDDLTKSIFKKAVAQELASRAAKKELELLDQRVKLGKAAAVVEEFDKNQPNTAGLDPREARDILQQKADKELATFLRIKNELREITELGQDAFADSLQFDKSGKPVETPLLRLKAKKIEIDEISTNSFTDWAVKTLIIKPEEVKILPVNQEALNKEFDRLSNLKPSQGLAGIGADKVNALKQMAQDASDAADVISNKLAPATDNFIDALFTGKDPIRAFFEGIQSAIQDTIKDLIQAAIRGLIFRTILSGGTGGIGGALAGAAGGIGGVAGIGGGQLTLGGGVNFRIQNGDLVAALDAGNASVKRNF